MVGVVASCDDGNDRQPGGGASAGSDAPGMESGQTGSPFDGVDLPRDPEGGAGGGAAGGGSPDEDAGLDAAPDAGLGPMESARCGQTAQATTTKITSSFADCTGGDGRVGQTASASDVTCLQVCCALGYSGCRFRAAQAGYDACSPSSPPMSGTCSDVFRDAWSSQCVCAP